MRKNIEKYIKDNNSSYNIFKDIIFYQNNFQTYLNKR